MSIESWLLFWKWLLILGVGMFAAMAVVVAIGGARDIRRLFRTLREQHAQQQTTTDGETGE